MFTLRFDMRSSPEGARFPDLYAAALDMCAWSETRGGVAVILSEHHAAEDGHLPSPLMSPGPASLFPPAVAPAVECDTSFIVPETRSNTKTASHTP